MASSCKRCPHRHLRYEVQHQHRCNKFTTKMHFNNGLALAVVAFVSVFMFSYQIQVLAEETQIVGHQIELTTKHVPQIPENNLSIVDNATTEAFDIKNNTTSIEFIIKSTNDAAQFDAFQFESTQRPDHNENQLHSGFKSTSPSQLDEKLYTSLEQTVDINNDIFSNVEEPQIKILPDLVNVHDDYLVSTENLEESIRNSVKTEMELEQNLESSPVLEILKDLPEPEIRKTLTADIMSLDQKNFDDNSMLLKANQEIIEESSESTLKILKSGSENITTRDAKKLEFQVSKTYNNGLSSELRLEENHFKTEEISKTNKEPFEPSQLAQNTSVKELVPFSINDTTKAKHLVVQETITYSNQSAQKSDSSLTLFSDSNSVKAENSESLNLKNEETSSSSSESNSLDNSEENLREKENVLASESASSENSEDFFEDNVNDITDKKSVENFGESSPKDVVTSHELHSLNISELTDIAMFSKNESDTFETKDDAVILNERYSATLLKTADTDLVDNLHSRDIATFNIDENLATEKTEDSLSVVLNETLSPNSLNPEYENLFSIEEKQNISLNVMTDAEIEESTEVPEEFKHVVIKKVLDVQEIYDDSFDTTIIPFTHNNELKSKDIAEELNVKQIIHDDLEYKNKGLGSTERDIRRDEKAISLKGKNDATQKDLNSEEFIEHQSNAKQIKRVLPKCGENTDSDTCGENAEDVKYEEAPYEILIPEALPPTTESIDKDTTEPLNYFHIASTTGSNLDAGVKLNSEFHIVDSISLKDMDHAKTVKGSRSVSRDNLLSHHEIDSAATLFEAYPPQDAGQTINDNLADEYAGIGKALPVSTKDGPNRSTIIIILSSGTAFLFIVVSVTIFLISFQRQHGTLDIEMQERSCGKDDLDEEDAETFAMLLEVELPPQVAIALDETEECL